MQVLFIGMSFYSGPFPICWACPSLSRPVLFLSAWSFILGMSFHFVPDLSGLACSLLLSDCLSSYSGAVLSFWAFLRVSACCLILGCPPILCHISVKYCLGNQCNIIGHCPWKLWVFLVCSLQDPEACLPGQFIFQGDQAGFRVGSDCNPLMGSSWQHKEFSRTSRLVYSSSSYSQNTNMCFKYFLLLLYYFSKLLHYFSPTLPVDLSWISFVCLIAWFAWAGLIRLRGLPYLSRIDQAGNGCLICLSRVGQAGKGCLICPSRIDQADRAAWFAIA